MELKVSKAGEEVMLGMETVAVDDENPPDGIVCVGNETTVLDQQVYRDDIKRSSPSHYLWIARAVPTRH